MHIPSGRHAIGRPLLVLAVVAALAASGCGRGTGSVTGTVKYKGDLLPIGDIAFLSQDGDQQVRHADIIEGKYTIPAIPAGVCKVVVTTWQPTPKGGHRKFGPGGPGTKPADPAPPPAVQAILIPKDYGDPDKSGLTYDVKAGSQTKDFDLGP